MFDVPYPPFPSVGPFPPDTGNVYGVSYPCTSTLVLTVQSLGSRPGRHRDRHTGPWSGTEVKEGQGTPTVPARSRPSRSFVARSATAGGAPVPTGGAPVDSCRSPPLGRISQVRVSRSFPLFPMSTSRGRLGSSGVPSIPSPYGKGTGKGTVTVGPLHSRSSLVVGTGTEGPVVLRNIILEGSDLESVIDRTEGMSPRRRGLTKGPWTTTSVGAPERGDPVSNPGPMS